MNHDQVAGRWKQVRGQVRQLWGNITGDRLQVAAGQLGTRLGRVQYRYGSSVAAAGQQLDDFLRRNRNWNPSRR
jgi:uncharacterized protein YjbJ (UPF0337 family)